MLAIFLVLNNISLQYIYFICSSLYLLIPYPQLFFSPFPLPTSNHQFVLHICESVSILLYLFIYFLDSTYKRQRVFVFLCMTYFIKHNTLRSIHVVTNGKISFFIIMVEQYSIIGVCVCVCVHIPSLSIHLVKGSQVVSMSWLL